MLMEVLLGRNSDTLQSNIVRSWLKRGQSDGTASFCRFSISFRLN